MGTTAEKLTYLNETKSKLKDNINLTGAGLTNQTPFRQYATDLKTALLNILNNGIDTLYNNFPKTTGTGTNITLNSTLQAPIRSVINGDTEQDSYSGKNLCKPIATTTKNGMTFTNNGDGSYTLNGTTTANSSFYIIGLNYSAGTYSLSANNTTTNSNGAFYIQAEYSGGSIRTSFSITNATITGTTTNPINAWSVVVPSGLTLNNFVIKPQLESGSTTSYEPYTGGIASPNPDYPQEIKSVTGLQKVSVVGKNLFDKDNANILNAQVNRTQLKLVGDTDARTLWIKIQPNTTYTVSKILSARFRVATLSTQPVLNADITKYVSDDSVTNLTITSEANDKYLAVMYYNSTLDTLTEQQILDSIQIEVGSTASEYQEYQSQEYEINLGNIHLYEDDQIIGTPYNWSIKHVMGEVVLDGSESGWSKSSNTNVDRYMINNNLYLNNSYSKCNYFTKGTTSNVDKGIWINNASVQLWFNYAEAGTTTLENWKTWLSTHNLKVVQPLKEPTTTPITDTDLIEDLNNFYNAKSYNGQTNISVEGDLPMILDVSAIIDE